MILRRRFPSGGWVRGIVRCPQFNLWYCWR